MPSYAAQDHLITKGHTAGRMFRSIKIAGPSFEDFG